MTPKAGFTVHGFTKQILNIFIKHMP